MQIADGELYFPPAFLHHVGVRRLTRVSTEKRIREGSWMGSEDLDYYAGEEGCESADSDESEMTKNTMKEKKRTILSYR